MKWILITKSPDNFPLIGNYKSWKKELRNEGKKQCVYCAITESAFGGYRNFHVEHFRPKGRFKDRTNDYGNLLYACAVCNTFKGDDWPKDDPLDDVSSLDVMAYPCPMKLNLSDILDVDGDGIVTSKYTAGAYLIERVYLNRPHLIRMRRLSGIRKELIDITREVARLMQGLVLGANLSGRTGSAMANAVIFLNEILDAAPYEPEDIRRGTHN